MGWSLNQCPECAWVLFWSRGSVHLACPSLLPVPAMNMELFCGWELAYVFCLISRPHSHFKARSTRGLDFLICLATESTTCMWDQLPARADNPSASKYTLPPPTSSKLHCVPPPSVKLPEAPVVLTGSGAAFPLPTDLTVVGEMLEMFSIAIGRLTLQSQGHFVFTRSHSVSLPWKQQTPYQTVCGTLIRDSAPHCWL